VYAITYLLVLPAGLLSRLTGKFFHSSLFFDFFAQMFSVVPGLPGVVIRACFYKQTLKKAYLDLSMLFGSFISKIDAELGRNILITGRTTIGLAKIGDNTVIANYVSILSGRYQHNFTDTNQDMLAGRDTFHPVTIGRNCFIGEKSLIMADIGDYSIIGAGSVVVKNIPDCVVAVGNPARVVKERPRPSGAD